MMISSGPNETCGASGLVVICESQTVMIVDKAIK